MKTRDIIYCSPFRVEVLAMHKNQSCSNPVYMFTKKISATEKAIKLGKKNFFNLNDTEKQDGICHQSP